MTLRDASLCCTTSNDLPSDGDTPAKFPTDDISNRTPATSRMSKRLKGAEPSPTKDALPGFEARTLSGGGAGGRATKESSCSTWNLDIGSRHVEFEVKEPQNDSDDEGSSDSGSDDDYDNDGCLSGSRIMNMRNLHEVSKNFCCKRCVQQLVNEVSKERYRWLDEFSEVLAEKLSVVDADEISDLKQSFWKSKVWKSRKHLNAVSKTMGVSIVDETRCGLASMFTWKCHGRGRQGRTHKFLQRTSKYISTPSDSRADGASSSTSAREKAIDHEVNANEAIAMVSIGCGSADLNALAAHLDVPLAPRFAETYRKCEEFIGKAMIAVADESQNEACAVSAQMARERADEFASRAVPLPIGTTVNFEGRELTNIGASFDGAWQQRSIGHGSYSSKSGHALMVCAISKKVLDREVKRTQCSKCDTWLGKRKRDNDNEDAAVLAAKRVAFRATHECANFVGSAKSMEAACTMPEAIAQRSRPAGNYSSGSSVAAENAHAAGAAAAAAAGASATATATRARPTPCSACGGADHSRRSSKLCGMYKPRPKPDEPAEPVERAS